MKYKAQIKTDLFPTGVGGGSAQPMFKFSVLTTELQKKVTLPKIMESDPLLFPESTLDASHLRNLRVVTTITDATRAHRLRIQKVLWIIYDKYL